MVPKIIKDSVGDMIVAKKQGEKELREIFFSTCKRFCKYLLYLDLYVLVI